MGEVGNAILIVDDEDSVLSSLRRLFRADGYRIHTASSAAEGLDILRNNSVGLVISDNSMPEVTGIEFLNQVRENWPDTLRIMLTGYADLDAATEAINRGEVYRFVVKPWNPDELRLLVRQGIDQHRLVMENRRMQALIQEQNDTLKGWNESLQQAVEQRTEEIRQKSAELERLYQRLKGSFLSTIKLFTGFIELRNPTFGRHARRVTLLTLSICRQMALSEELTTDFEIAALLHDIGKIGLPDDVLRRDEKHLSMRERDLLRQHPVAGQAVLQTIDNLEAVGIMVRHHHERWDGKGYPDGLRWDAIPMGSRIIAVADAFDHYQESKTGSPAAFVETQLSLGSGCAYDPTIVAALGEYLQTPSGPYGSREIALNVLELREGMVLSRDVTAATGLLIAPRGETLKRQHLDKLSHLVRQALVSPTIYVHG